MAVWLPAQNRFYLPPAPVTRILSTEDYVHRTDVYVHASTERLLTVGHPYYAIVGSDGTVKVPKVSSSQYRAFRCRFPDPNNFAFGDTSIFNAETERLCWALRGIEVGRGQPLGIGATGHPYTNRFQDVENPFNPQRADVEEEDADDRLNVAFDPKQTQLIIVGCRPAQGEHWDAAPWCASDAPAENNRCPPLELRSTVIEDSDMVDIGLGNLNFESLQDNKADAPLDIVRSICKYPDFLKMSEDPYGDEMFFFTRREALYARHMFQRSGDTGDEKVPQALYLNATSTKGTDNYYISPSGSLVTSEQQLFNRPYWLRSAQGHNNGILWHNEAFVTVVDTTRGTNFNVNRAKTKGETDFKNGKFSEFLRHCEEYQLSFILQLCKVSLTPENLAYIHTMDQSIIEAWHLSVNAPPNADLEDKYRYIQSLATKCPTDVTTSESTDPYSKYRFWDIDLTDRITEQLDQTPLGRKFRFQGGLQGGLRGSTSSVSPARRGRPGRAPGRTLKRKR
ncbi:major capsid protein [Erethizon dorsatum papillomavirus 1]|uniref:Major capsid protein L1 n=1 Tax=Erethizon dorsatum papillomavirus 1 TaxID=291590 RepID=Q5IRF0_9PAPI|nr:major capsid protein [Erethizon dorsatum papillomavirus 1]AAU11499.1 major capsid protein [Erethizon dorsatum papillomavirus 1]